MDKIDWPRWEVVSDLEPDEGAKLLYQARLDLIKADYQAAIDVNKVTLLVDIEQKKAERLAAIEVQKAKRVATIDKTKAGWTNEYIMRQAVHNAYLEAAKQQMDKAISRAEFVQKAAGAISTIYVAILALSFGRGENEVKLPIYGTIPTLFLGIAITLSTAYIAFLTNPKDLKRGVPSGDLVGDQDVRLNDFIRWAKIPILARAHLLQASVISLGVGIAFLPVAYLSRIDQTLLWFGWTLADYLSIIFLLALSLVILWALLSWHAEERKIKNKPFWSLR